MVGEVTPPKPTPEELERLEAEVRGLRDIKRLLNSGPGGIAQLRRVTMERLTNAENRLAVAVTYARDS